MNYTIPTLVTPAMRAKARAEQREAQAADKLAEAIAKATDEEQHERASGGPDLVGLSLPHCIRDLVQHPELIERVKKIVCEGEYTPASEAEAALITRLAGRLYFPHFEGRVHQMPQGNPGYRGLPSRWWITNLDYRKVLTAKLRALAAQLRDGPE